MAVSSIGRLAGPIISIAKAATAASELLATIDAKVPDLGGLKAPTVSAEDSINFRNVSFAYPSRPDIKVLDQLNVRFDAGKVTAIVGPSGSGKSTIVGLLDRWYELSADDTLMGIKRSEGDPLSPPVKGKSLPEVVSAISVADPLSSAMEGSITVGTTSICELDCKWWRSKIGLVQQEPFLFNDSIFKNVAFGLCGTQWQDASDEDKLKMVKAACSEAYADEFINQLPNVCFSTRTADLSSWGL
jgi:ATP-binding cassette subfamily B (MDR/TAP) protein 1